MAESLTTIKRIPDTDTYIVIVDGKEIAHGVSWPEMIRLVDGEPESMSPEQQSRKGLYSALRRVVENLLHMLREKVL